MTYNEFLQITKTRQKKLRRAFKADAGLELGADIQNHWESFLSWLEKVPTLKEEEMYGSTSTTTVFDCILPPGCVKYTSPYSFANTPAAPQQEKKEPTVLTIEQQTLDYLGNRLSNVFYHHDEKLPRAYGLRDDDPPKDHEEFHQRLKDGLFTIEKKKDGHYWSWYDSFRWRDPDQKEDMEGYDAARKLLKQARDAAKDIIMVKTADEGLEALQAFEKEEFGPKALKKSKS